MRALEFIRDHVTFKLPCDFSHFAHENHLGQLNIAVHSLFDSLLHILWYTVLGLQRYTALHKHQYTVVHKRFRIEFHISERKERISFKTCYLGTEPKKVEVVLRTRFS